MVWGSKQSLLVKLTMNHMTSNGSPIVKCSHCKQIYSVEAFNNHGCNLPLTDVKHIPVVYFQDDSINGKKIMTGRGIDGILYSFIVIPRTAIPYMKSLTDDFLQRKKDRRGLDRTYKK